MPKSPKHGWGEEGAVCTRLVVISSSMSSTEILLGFVAQGNKILGTRQTFHLF